LARDEAVDNANAQVAKLSKEEQEAMADRMNAIYRNLADLRHGSPESEEVQSAIGEWYEFLNGNFGHPCSPAALKELGDMYVEDERFTQNIDKFGTGLAAFMRDAMAVYADKNKQ
jgi:hypothetical protein